MAGALLPAQRHQQNARGDCGRRQTHFANPCHGYWQNRHLPLTCHLLTREKRVNGHRKRILEGYNDELRTFIHFVLFQYVKSGVGELDKAKLPDLLELKYEAVADAVDHLGGVGHIRSAFVGFQQHLY